MRVIIDYSKLEEIGNKLIKYQERNGNILTSFKNNIDSLDNIWTSSNKDIIVEYTNIIKKNIKNENAFLQLVGPLLKDIKQDFEITEEKYLLLIEENKNEQN